MFGMKNNINNREADPGLLSKKNGSSGLDS
ncbi:hypothetical protein RSAG8_03568, partial [Rhizoctonia solani AG-8 WAC10335]